jgi:uncharacterized protein YecE (DUF72 family)
VPRPHPRWDNVRLHGRNYTNWFAENQTVNDRYDYLYSVEEPWVDRIKTVVRHAEDTYVVTHNHKLGKAVVNAFELTAFLSGRPVRAPEQLASRYPVLKQLEQKRVQPGQTSRASGDVA